MHKAIFIDKDGTLIKNIPYNVNPELISFEEHTLEGLKLLKQLNYLIIIISNQSGVAYGYFSEESLMNVRKRIEVLLQDAGLRLDGFYYCPHHPRGRTKQYALNCTCRKPQPGLIFRAAEELNIDLSSSWMIGDILDDIEAGNKAGCKTILINNGNETQWLIHTDNQPYAVSESINRAADIILTDLFSVK